MLAETALELSELCFYVVFDGVRQPCEDLRPGLGGEEVRRALLQLEPVGAQALPGANAVTVDLFDGSGNTALGAQPRDLLQGKGFRIGGDTWLTTRSSTVLRNAPGDETGLALVKQALEATIKAESDKGVANGHVRVLLGNDFPGAPAGSGSQSPAATSSPVPATPPRRCPAHAQPIKRSPPVACPA